MTIQQGDFIELDYTGKLADSKDAFDTTQEDVAKKEDIYSEKTTYGPVTIVVGEGHVVQGLDSRLVGSDIGSHSFEIPAVEAFGKKTADKLSLVPAKFFKKQNIRPFVGLQVNVDNEIGVVRSVSGGRIMVDFNHPLASKDVVYDVDIKRVVDDNKEKIESFFKLMGLPYKSVDIKDKEAIITTQMDYPQEITSKLTDDLKRLISLDTFTFKSDKPEQQKEKSETSSSE